MASGFRCIERTSVRRTSEAVRVRLRWAIADEAGRRAADVACCMVPITARLRLHAMLCVWGARRRMRSRQSA